MVRHVGLLAFSKMTVLDLVGPAEAFASVVLEGLRGRPRPGYQVHILGLSTEPQIAESGVTIVPHHSLDQAPALDTIIVPGGSGLREATVQNRVAEWLQKVAPRTRRVASVCTGIYALGASGLLDGRRATTHWRFAADVADRFPRIQLQPEALFIKQGRFYTSAGVTAGIDLALAMIEEDYGPHTALAVARELVVYMKRPGGQEQYSEPLRFQTRAEDRMADLVAWVNGHLDQDLSIDALARRACLGTRQFTRRFKGSFGMTPAAFVRATRLDEARTRLTAANNSVETIARSVGFGDPDSFSRAFIRRFRLTPGAYRTRFASARNGARG